MSDFKILDRFLPPKEEMSPEQAEWLLKLYERQREEREDAKEAERWDGQS